MQQTIPLYTSNPTDEERYQTLKYLLKNDNRLEDFNNIINLMSPPEDIEKICSKLQGKGIKVAIIGAGLSGLCISYELNKIGCDITIFEASKRIGGRVLTHYFNKETNQYAELGPMRIGISHETTWHYIKKFKLKTRPFISKSPSSLFYIRGSYAVNDPKGKNIMDNIYPQFKLTSLEKKLPPSKLISQMYNKYFYSLTASERSELIKIKKSYSHKIKEIQNLSLRNAYENSYLSQDAISMISLISTLEADLLHISLFEILGELYTLDFVFNYTIEGGMINLPQAFYSNLIQSDGPGKIEFKFGHVINSIIKSPYRDKIILEIADLNEKNIHYKEFDYVVCCIPFSSLRRIKVTPPFSTMKMQAINEVNYETAQKTFFYLKERFWEKNSKNVILGTTLTDLITISTLYGSDHIEPTINNNQIEYKIKPNTNYKEPGVLLASYNWHQNALRLGSQIEILRIKEISNCMELIHRLPENYIDDNLIDYSTILWSNVPFIWGGACLMTPGQKDLFLYESTLPEMNNRVFFAGEHVSTKHAWQQGSLQSAMQCANDIAKSIRQRS
ncbi:flavin monoamine oxidase family protein [Thermobrachium celere]|uniref:Tryptophan 2-monooxygenase n=1 Tax=Thermobrachium celere DSM 8682 TaxID=941824 RepID=R7RSN0_9CLOT|nr:FAD-dependent oxidoreductase [Thermobrachium celere]CDF58396.1 Tryptophan 2-monooxygenase [Thermobrachium celere DSM 8682]